MASIPDHVIDEIKSRADIVEVVSGYFPLRQSGANFRALCPFHDERTPSFNVNQAKQIFHCFGCGEGGNVFTFVMKYEKISFPEAARMLAARYGVTIPETGREYGGETVGGTSLARIRYGAYLHDQTGLPLLVTGGRAQGDNPSEGEAMAQALEQSFGVTARWIEIKAANTYGNAENSAAILHPLGIRNIYLVTSGSHMRRAVASFESVGFTVTPAPTNLAFSPEFSIYSLIPSAKSIYASATAMHEWSGLVWYRWTYL